MKRFDANHARPGLSTVYRSSSSSDLDSSPNVDSSPYRSDDGSNVAQSPLSASPSSYHEPLLPHAHLSTDDGEKVTLVRLQPSKGGKLKYQHQASIADDEDTDTSSNDSQRKHARPLSHASLVASASRAKRDVMHSSTLILLFAGVAAALFVLATGLPLVLILRSLKQDPSSSNESSTMARHEDTLQSTFLSDLLRSASDRLLTTSNSNTASNNPSSQSIDLMTTTQVELAPLSTAFADACQSQDYGAQLLERWRTHRRELCDHHITYSKQTITDDAQNEFHTRDDDSTQSRLSVYEMTQIRHGGPDLIYTAHNLLFDTATSELTFMNCTMDESVEPDRSKYVATESQFMSPFPAHRAWTRLSRFSESPLSAAQSRAIDTARDGDVITTLFVYRDCAAPYNLFHCSGALLMTYQVMHQFGLRPERTRIVLMDSDTNAGHGMMHLWRRLARRGVHFLSDVAAMSPQQQMVFMPRVVFVPDGGSSFVWKDFWAESPCFSSDSQHSSSDDIKYSPIADSFGQFASETYVSRDQLTQRLASISANVVQTLSWEDEQSTHDQTAQQSADAHRMRKLRLETLNGPTCKSTEDSARETQTLNAQSFAAALAKIPSSTCSSSPTVVKRRRLLLLSRSNAGYRRITNEAELAQQLADTHCTLEVVVVQLQLLSFERQVQLMHTADVILAMHGAAITLTGYLSPIVLGSLTSDSDLHFPFNRRPSMIELFRLPTDRPYCYSNWALMRRMSYRQWINNDPNANTELETQVNVHEIVQIVDEELKRTMQVDDDQTPVTPAPKTIAPT